MKKIKTFKQFRLSNKELDTELKDAEGENELLKKHFRLLRLQRNTERLKKAVETERDELDGVK